MTKTIRSHRFNQSLIDVVHVLSHVTGTASMVFGTFIRDFCYGTKIQQLKLMLIAAYFDHSGSPLRY